MSDQFTMKLTNSYIARYRKASKKERSALLTEYCISMAIGRKAATKRLSRMRVLPSVPKSFRPKRNYGRKKIYLPFHANAVRKAWKLSGMICAERLQPMLGEYLQSLHQARIISLSRDDRDLLARIPLISLKRIIDAFEEKIRDRMSPPKRKRGNPALYKQIPISAAFGKRNDEKPGLIEVDYVEHTGGVKTGRIVITGTYTDIVCGWTVRAAAWGANLTSLQSIHDHASRRVYHAPREYHPDNAPGLLRLLFERVRENQMNRQRKTLKLSRSRPYESNDNAHVEQKNRDKVRNLIGYHRYDQQKQSDILNKIYEVCDVVDNFFIASAKLQKAVKNRQGKVIRRIHDKPQTPYMRLINDDHVGQSVKSKLRQIKAKLNLVLLVEEKNRLLKELFETI